MMVRQKRTCPLFFAFACVVACCLALSASVEAVTEEWVARYDGPAVEFDKAYDITVDAAGSVYVTGFSDSDSSIDENWDYVTIKYDSDGVLKWAVTYAGPGTGDYDEDVAYAIAVDGSGYVYVTGRSYGTGADYDYVTIKYSPKGSQQWAARYAGPGSDEDRPYAIALDDSGNVYVTGESVGSLGTPDYATVKYNSSGGQTWVARYDGPDLDEDGARAIAVDGSGNVHVTGHSDGIGTSSDYATIKYNSFGGQTWVARYDGPAGINDGANGITLDDSGNVHVTGYSSGIGTSYDYATVKYDSGGVQTWVARYNGPGDDTDYAETVALDDSGNVYVTGNSEGSTSGRDYATVKYSSGGGQLWVARYNGSGNSTDYGNDLAVDGSGNAYVTGCSARGGSGSSYWDCATIKYDSAGSQQWAAFYDGPAGGHDCTNAVFADDFQHVYVTGQSLGIGTYMDAVTIKYSGCEDNDLDTYDGYDPATCPEGTDCDDSDPDVNPDETEVCNGIDDNCVDGIDEGGNALCDNGAFCDGPEWCAGVGGCMPGAEPCPDDGIFCTVDYCDEAGDACVVDYNAMNGQNCDNGLYCDGPDQCSGGICKNVGPPIECDDGKFCTEDTCDEIGDTCVYDPDPMTGTNCDNGLYCDGYDECSDGECKNVGPAVECDDGVFCTTDYCDEAGDACVYDPDAMTGQGCDNGIYCDGPDECGGGTCNNVGPAVVCDDGEFCTFDTCYEPSDTCLYDPDPMNGTDCDNGLYCDGDDQCGNGTCNNMGIPLECDDGLFCTGDEYCDEDEDECASLGDPCMEGECCDEDADTCVTIAVTVDEPVAATMYPADTGLLISWNTAGEACMDSSDVTARFTLDAESFDVLLMTGLSPSDSMVWDTPVIDWVDMEIRVKVSDPSDALTVEGASGSFELYVPRTPSITYDPALGEAALAWAGGISDVLVLDGAFDPGFTGAVLVASIPCPWVDTDAGTSAQRYYRILNAGTSAPSPITLGKRDIAVWMGYNLLGVPLYYDDELWASEIAADIASQGGSVIEISKWVSASATWVTHDPSWPVVDFVVRPGEGFFLKAGSDFTWSIAGEVMRGDTISIDTVYGYAMFSVPTWEYDMASDVADAMIAQGGDPQEISHWLSTAGIWQTYDITWPLVNYAIDAVDGYIVRAGVDAPFTLNPMDVLAVAISATEAQITFDTDVSGAAFIKVGTNPGLLDSLSVDDRDPLFEGTDHIFTLTGLTPGLTYFFEILFLGETFGDDGEPYSFDM